MDGYIATVDRIDGENKTVEKCMGRLKQLAAIRPGAKGFDTDTAAGDLFTDDQKAGLVRATRQKASYGTTMGSRPPVGFHCDDTVSTTSWCMGP